VLCARDRLVNGRLSDTLIIRMTVRVRESLWQSRLGRAPAIKKPPQDPRDSPLSRSNDEVVALSTGTAVFSVGFVLDGHYHP
jgi:hypothetical protein